MAKNELSWFAAKGCWRKRMKIGGKVRAFYFPGGSGKSDRKAYREALTKWESMRVRLLQDEAQGQPQQSQNIKRSYTHHTAEALVGRFIASKSLQVDLGNLSPARLAAMKHHALAFEAHFEHLDDIRKLNEAFISRFRDAQLSLVQQEKIKPATCKLRFQIVKQMLQWAFEEGELPTIPRNLKSLKITVPSNGIETVPIADIKQLFSLASDRTRLYLLLGLNCGYTQSDISSLEISMIDIKEGTITRDRQKTGQEQSHKLWPITLRYLKQEMRNAKTGLALVTQNNKPLRSEEFKNGKYHKRDAIQSAWQRILKHADMKHSFKLLRKTGATEIAKIDATVVNQFLAHSPRSIADRHYVKADFTNLYKAIQELQKVFNLK